MYQQGILLLIKSIIIERYDIINNIEFDNSNL